MSTLRPLFPLFSQSVGYGFGVFGRQLILLLAFPLFTRILPQTELGVVFLAIAAMAFVNTLTNAGLPAATFRFYQDTRDPEKKQLILGSALQMFIGFSALAAITCLVFSEKIALALLGNSENVIVIQLTAILVVVDTAVNYCYVLLRIQIRPITYSVVNVLIVATQMLAALALVVWYGMGAAGYVAGLLIGEVIGLIALALLTRNLISLRGSRVLLEELMRYGAPLLPTALAMWALQLADRAMISHIAGLNQLAIYEVSYKVAAVVGLAMAPVRTAWPPFAFSVMRKPDAAFIYRDVLTYVTFAALVVGLGIYAFRGEILAVLAPASYNSGLSIVGLLALSQVFLASYMVLSIGPKVAKKTTDLMVVALLSAFVSVLLNLFLIPLVGIMGAAISAAIGYGLLAIGSYIIGQKSFPFPLDWSRLARLFAAVGASLLIMETITVTDLTCGTLYIAKATAWALFVLFSGTLGVISSSQVRMLFRAGIAATRNRKKEGAEQGM